MYKQNIFPWNKNYEINVEVIDNQHKKLVELLNQFCAAALDIEKSPEEILILINESFKGLVEYTKYHFDFEEKEYIRALKDEDMMKKHINKHNGMLVRAKKFKTRFDNSSDDLEIEKIITFLVLWLSEHILIDDAKMFSIMSFLDEGVSFEKSVLLAEIETRGEKAHIAETMTTMIKISTGLSMNLRREIIVRKKVEKELNEEINLKKEAEVRLKYLARHDELTGLINRRFFAELSDVALKIAKRNKTDQALLYLDIDGFKDVNDTMGHKAGDTLLISIASRLLKAVRESDIVARVGGDEFTIHLSGKCGMNDVKTIASNIIERISVPFILEDFTAKVGVSIGISFFPHDGVSIESLIINADAAMYVAKKTGKNSYKLFNEC